MSSRDCGLTDWSPRLVRSVGKKQMNAAITTLEVIEPEDQDEDRRLGQDRDGVDEDRDRIEGCLQALAVDEDHGQQDGSGVADEDPMKLSTAVGRKLRSRIGSSATSVRATWTGVGAM